MSTLEIIFLAIALAMDCFTVSIVSGIILRKFIWSILLRIAILFGVFQALMPLIGWYCTHYFSDYIEAYDHWIAFTLLAYLGGNMIKESFSEEEEKHFDPADLKTQLTLSVATSIDALAVGISFTCLGYCNIQQMSAPLIAIGTMSFLFSIIGSALGITLGNTISKKLRPELLGGIILLIIGIKILVSHLWG